MSIALSIAGVVLLAGLIVLSHLRLVRGLRTLRRDVLDLKEPVRPPLPIETDEQKIARLRGTILAAKAIELTLTGEELVERLNLAQARSSACYAREELRRLGVEA